jgi:hypothetical protein
MAGRVSQRVNSVVHDDEACLQPPPPDEAGGDGGQFSLGL